MKSKFILVLLLGLFVTLAGCENRTSTITPYNLTDENWTGGVAKNWAGFFVEYTPELEKKLAVGEELVFSDESIRKVIRQDHSGKFLNIYLEGSSLDGKLIGYPKTIEIKNKD